MRLAVELSEPIQAAVTTLRKLEKQAAEALAGLKDGEEGGGGKGSHGDKVMPSHTLLYFTGLEANVLGSTKIIPHQIYGVLDCSMCLYNPSC